MFFPSGDAGANRGGRRRIYPGRPIAGIDEKLKRRHPHVWGDWQVADTAEVLVNWEKLKAEEKEETPGFRLDGIPRALPALARSQKIQRKARKAGFDWPDIDGVYDKVEEEIRELQDGRRESSSWRNWGSLFCAGQYCQLAGAGCGERAAAGE
jgi:uncharacterized protein YabN with tetrapyrrole methylase and pyrophosphatase domain